jgi:hypothetical protein
MESEVSHQNTKGKKLVTFIGPGHKMFAQALIVPCKPNAFTSKHKVTNRKDVEWK